MENTGFDKELFRISLLSTINIKYFDDSFVHKMGIHGESDELCHQRYYYRKFLDDCDDIKDDLNTLFNVCENNYLRIIFNFLKEELINNIGYDMEGHEIITYIDDIENFPDYKILPDILQPNKFSNLEWYKRKLKLMFEKGRTDSFYRRYEAENPKIDNDILHASRAIDKQANIDIKPLFTGFDGLRMKIKMIKVMALEFKVFCESMDDRSYKFMMKEFNKYDLESLTEAFNQTKDFAIESSGKYGFFGILKQIHKESRCKKCRYGKDKYGINCDNHSLHLIRNLSNYSYVNRLSGIKSFDNIEDLYNPIEFGSSFSKSVAENHDYFIELATSIEKLNKQIFRKSETFKLFRKALFYWAVNEELKLKKERGVRLLNDEDYTELKILNLNEADDS